MYEAENDSGPLITVTKAKGWLIIQQQEPCISHVMSIGSRQSEQMTCQPKLTLLASWTRAKL